MNLTQTNELNLEARRAEILQILKRRSWFEEANLIKELHDISQEIYGAPNPSDGNRSGWSMGDTAKAIGTSLSTVLVNLRLAKCCQLDPTLAVIEKRGVAVEAMHLRFYWVSENKVVRR